MLFWQKFNILKSGKEPPKWLDKFRRWIYGFSLLALLFIILESGLKWKLPAFLSIISLIVDYIIFFTFLADAFLTFYFTFPKSAYLRNNWLDLLVFIPLVFNIVTMRAGAGIIVIRHMVVLVKVFTRTRKFANLLRGVRLNTPQVVALSFIAVILTGSILLTFPTATVDGRGTNIIDALFTATSATCVTGLIVQDTPTYFSGFGQIVILVLIQLGGLGIMTYSAFLTLLVGKFTLGQRKMVQDMMEEERNVLNIISYIFKMTLLLELIGMSILFLRWVTYFKDAGQALYFSIFHSISAFCNAGFSLFSDSLVGFVADPIINLTVMGLIIIGGIGFIVVYEVTNRLRYPRNPLSTHTKLVLITSAVLIILGFLAFFFFEFDGAILNHSLTSKFWVSLFQSVTPRTAGFNTISIASLSTITLTIMIILMFIGASPGSTGGGIKTSTLAILLLSIRAIYRRKENIEVFNRTIPSTVAYKAIALFISAIIILISMFLLLLAFENKPFLPLLFEAVSAFGTVGLSTGITPNLTIVGKLLIMFLMFIGRIGPLTIGLALARETTIGKVTHPEARVMIG